MTTTHTPGPWTTEPNAAGGLLVRNGKGRVIAGADAEQAGDMLLIAAAPELLEALRRATEKMRRANSIQHSGGKVRAEDWAELHQFSNECAAAIAKAEGAE